MPILTPFTKDEALDEAALRRLVSRLVSAGIHGIMPVGSSGEFWAVDDDERYRILEIVLDEVAGRVPVLAGTCAICTRKSIALARRAEALHVDALVVLTPFYVTPTQDELTAHYSKIADSVSLPVLPYNNPNRTGGVALAPETVAHLAAEGAIVGIKDSSGNLGLVAEIINGAPRAVSTFSRVATIFCSRRLLLARSGAVAPTATSPQKSWSTYMTPSQTRTGIVRERLRASLLP